MRKISACLISSLIFITSAFCQPISLPDAYEPVIVKQFADDLYKNGFWDEAASEYKRYLFLDGTAGSDSTEIDLSKEDTFFLLTTIYNSQNNKDGISWLSTNFRNRMGPAVKEKLDLVSARFTFKERNLEDFLSLTTLIAPDFKDYSDEFVLLNSISISLLQMNIEEAISAVNQASQTYQIFTPFAQTGSHYKTKSPGLALFFSAILPGSGKWYASSSFIPFLTSFVTVGSFTAATIYTGIKSEWKSWRPYVYGTCALVFYITDLYGSYKSAQRWNNTKYRELCEQADLIYEQLY